MELLDNQLNTTSKIYSSPKILIATFIGGLLAPTYLIYENFKAFGENSKANKALIIGILVTIVLYISVLTITIEIPSTIFGVAYIGLTYGVIKVQFGTRLEVHEKNGGLMYSWGRTLLIAFMSLLITIASIFAILYATDSTGNNEQIVRMGQSGHEIHYDPATISKAEVKELGMALTQAQFFDNYQQQIIYVNQTGNQLEIYIGCVPELRTDSSILIPFKELQANLTSLLPQKHIVLLLVVDDLDDVVHRIE